MRALLVLLATTMAFAQAPRATVAYGCPAEELDTAGLTCTAAHPCPVYLELAALEPLAGKLFVSGNLHTADATLAAVLLASEDGGRTWTEPHPRISGAGIEQIQFFDLQNGWIGGQLLQGRPHDAFLLITRDGGKTWHSRPVFEDTRVGLIQQFWFTSKDAGSLLIDRMQPGETGSRYELYESQTAGESWMLQQVSARPLTIKRSRAGQGTSDWRLRADAATKTYQVEQRQAERWRAVAAFPIQVTECKGLEVTLAEPQPEPEEAKPAAPAPSLKKKKK